MNIDNWVENVRDRVRRGLPATNRPNAQVAMDIWNERCQKIANVECERITAILADATSPSIRVKLQGCEYNSREGDGCKVHSLIVEKLNRDLRSAGWEVHCTDYFSELRITVRDKTDWVDLTIRLGILITVGILIAVLVFTTIVVETKYGILDP